jgi:hypothetical protein
MRVPAKYPPEGPGNGSNLQTVIIAVILVVAVIIVVVTDSTAGLADLGALLVAVASLISQWPRR